MPSTSSQPTTETRYQCRHVHPSGHRCSNPSLRSEPVCFQHRRRTRIIADPSIPPHEQPFDFPPIEDRAGIHLALWEVLRRLATNTLDPKRAGQMLYGLQVASSNLPPHPRQPATASPNRLDEEPNPRTISTLAEEIEFDPLDPSMGPLAPELIYDESHGDPPRNGFFDQLIALYGKPEPTQPEPTTVPTIQAVARPDTRDLKPDTPRRRRAKPTRQRSHARAIPCLRPCPRRFALKAALQLGLAHKSPREGNYELRLRSTSTRILLQTANAR